MTLAATHLLLLPPLLLLLLAMVAQATVTTVGTAACPAKLLWSSCFHCNGTGAGCKQLAGGNLNTSSDAECCAACALHAECDMWTRQPQTDNNNCYLKKALPGVQPSPTACKATSGVMPPHPPPPTPPPPPAPTPLPAGTSPRDFKNVLFIAVDDLRPEIAAYGHSYMHTPHIDSFAKQSTVFTRAYVQYAFCGPSRNSFMVRPTLSLVLFPRRSLTRGSHPRSRLAEGLTALRRGRLWIIFERKAWATNGSACLSGSD